VTKPTRAVLAFVLFSLSAPAWCAEATAGASLDPNSLLGGLTRVKHARTLRSSSWNPTGRNSDAWTIEPGEKRELANLKGPGCITHVWMTQNGPGVLRNVVLKMYWDNEREPSVLAPLGDFFCLGNGVTNSFQSLPFATSVREENQNKFNATAGLNCYLPMPFRKSARIEVENQGGDKYRQYFYIDYELYDAPLPDDTVYLHAQFRRENPTDGWGPEIKLGSKEYNVVNAEKQAWDENYLILDAKGRGHYIGCNLSVANLTGGWWGEGDDMIWIDGYKWPPDLHGTGSEDYLGHAYGMQKNAYMMNGSSVWQSDTKGYQTSYVFHLTNPVRFEKEIRVTIEHGHGNHQANDYASVAYWYQLEAHQPFGIVPVAQRQPIKQDAEGKWILDPANQTPQKPIELNEERKQMKQEWGKKAAGP